MIHRLLKRNRPRTASESESLPKPEFSLGFSASQTMDKTIEEIIRVAESAQLEKETEKIDLSTLPSPQPLSPESHLILPEISPSPTVFAKKTISKSKTFQGLSNPLKVPSYLQKPTSTLTQTPPFNSIPTLRKTIATPSSSSSTPTTESPLATSFRIPSSTSPSNSSIQAIRIAIGKEILKSAASCQMISIQEAHSMGSKLVLTSAGLLIPTIAQLLHRDPESIQKHLLQKTGKSTVPFDYFQSLIRNQSIQKFHSLLVPYKIIPIFHRGNSLTILTEHPLLVPLAEAILTENQISIPWIHAIPLDLTSLQGVA